MNDNELQKITERRDALYREAQRRALSSDERLEYARLNGEVRRQRQMRHSLEHGEGGAARSQSKEACKPVTSDEALRVAKEKRFALSATMLADKQIKVTMVKNPNAPLASMNVATNELTLNEGDARLDWSDPIKSLIYTRANLYHEVLHSLFTGNVRAKLKALMSRTSDKETFNLLRNALEDGRIERRGRGEFAGMGDFLDAQLMDIAKSLGKGELDGLHIYVRTGLFRNAHEASYWKPYQAQIDKAVKARSTSAMLDIAFAITEALSKKQGEQEGEAQGEGEQTTQGDGDGEQGAGDSESDESGEGESEGDASGGEGEGDSGEGESDASEAEGEAQGDGDGDGEGDQSESGDAGAGAGAGSGDLDKEVKKALEDMVKQALVKCGEQAQNDLDAILTEAEAYEPEQTYASDHESGASDELASAFTALLVESARTRYHDTRRGLLNQATLANALTSRKCFHKREDTPSAPYVALLLDVSGSMAGEEAALTQAARILNGALQKAKIARKVISFGGIGELDALNEFKVLPSDQALITHGGTPTHLAMSAANDWLEREGATRGLIIVATDGGPNDLALAQEQLERARCNGAFVIGVVIGGEDARIYINAPCALRNITAQFDSFDFCPDVSKLATVVEPLLGQFIAGA